MSGFVKHALMPICLAIGIVGGCVSIADAACPGNTQAEMNACAGARFQIAEQRLNRALSRLPPSDGLTKSQKAWLAYREAQCAFEAQEFEGGSMQPLVIGECLTDLTSRRAKLLEDMAKR